MTQDGDKLQPVEERPETQAPKERPARPSRWRRWTWRLTKVFFFLLLFLGVLVYGVLAYLRTDSGRETLRAQILQRTAELVPGLRIGKIEGDYTSHLAVSKLVLQDRFGGEAIAVERIGLRYDLTRLKDQRVQIDEVHLVRPHIVMRPTKSGKINFAELLAPQPPKPEEPDDGEPLAWTIRLGALRIEKGSFDAPAIGEKGLHVEDLDLDLGAEVAGKDISAELRKLQARITLPDGRRLRASLGLQAKMRGEEIDAALQLNARDASSKEDIALTLKAKGKQEALALRLDGKFPGAGSMQLKGIVGQRGETPHAKLELALANILPAKIVPGLGLPKAKLGLKLKTKLRGIPLQKGSEAQLELDVIAGSHAMGYRLDRLALRAETKGEVYSLKKLRARAYGAKLELSARGTQQRLGDAKVKLDVPAIARLPLGGFEGAGSAQIRASASGPMNSLRAHLTVQARGVKVPGVSIGSVDLDARARNLPDIKRAHAKLRLRATAVDTGDKRLRVDHARVDLDGGLTNVDLALEARGPRLQAHLELKSRQDGKFAKIKVALEKLKAAALGYRVALVAPTQVEIRPGREITLSKTRLALLGGKLSLEGRFRPRGFPRAEAKISLRGIRPPKGPHLSGEIEAKLDRRALEARVALRLPAQGRVRLDTTIPLRYRRGVPEPAWKEPLRLKVRAHDLDLAALSKRALGPKTLAGRLALSLEADGKLKDPRVHAELSWRGARFEEMAPLGGELGLTVRPKESIETTLSLRHNKQLLALRAKLGASLAPLLQNRALRWLKGEGPEVEVRLDVPRTKLSALGAIHPALATAIAHRKGALEAHVGVRGQLSRPRVEARLAAKDMVLEVDAKPTSLALELHAKAADQSVETKTKLALDARPLLNVQATLGSPLAALIAGRDPLQAPLHAQLTLHETRLQALEGLVPALKKAAGKLTARVTATGSAKQPRVEATLEVKGTRFDNAAAGDLKVEARYAMSGRHAQLHSKLGLIQPVAKDGRRGSLEGDVRLTLSARGMESSQLSAKLRGKSLDLAFLQHIAPGLQQSGGKLSLQLDATGKPTHPRLSGHIGLEEGLFRPRGMTAVKKVNARLAIAPGKVKLERLTLRSAKGGSLRATGDVALDKTFAPRRFGFHTVAKDFKLDAPGMQNLRMSFDVKGQGALEDGALNTGIKLRRGELWLPKMSGGRDLHATSASLPDVRFVDGKAKPKAKAKPAPSTRPTKEEPAKASPPKKAGGMKVALHADPLFVRSEELDIEVATDLKVRMDERGRPRVGGKLSIRRGTVRILGNAYRVERAQLRFSERAMPDPSLDVSLSREMSGVTVFIGVRGMASAPELILRSEPPQYDRAQLLSLVLTGRIDPRKGGESGDQGAALATAAANALVGGMLSNVIPKMGVIDTARVGLGQSKDEETGEQQFRAEVEVGKYLTKRLYLAVRRLFNFADNADGNLTEAMLEYRISARWLLVALFGDAGVGGLDAMWTYRY